MKLPEWFSGRSRNNSLLNNQSEREGDDGLDYELQLLEECKLNSQTYIEKMAELEIEDIDKTIRDYEDQELQFLSRGKVIICSIISEKLNQLKKARAIIEKRIQESPFFRVSYHRLSSK